MIKPTIIKELENHKYYGVDDTEHILKSISSTTKQLLKEIEKKFCDCADFVHYKHHTIGCSFYLIRQLIIKHFGDGK